MSETVKIHPVMLDENVPPHSKDAAGIHKSSGLDPVQELRRLGDIRTRKLKALNEEEYEIAAELQDEEHRVLRAISNFQLKHGSASESEFSPLATILRESNNAFVLATCDSSDELLESLTNCQDEKSLEEFLKMVGHEQYARVRSWNRYARKFRTDVVNTQVFTGIIFLFIFFATAAVGLQTHYNGPVHLHLAAQYPELKERGETILKVLDYLDIVVMIVFLLEAVLKVLAEGSAPFRYFGDSWNIFDMFIVSVGFLPFDTGQIMMLRLLRLLRVFKMVRALPALQVIMRGMLGACKQLVFVGGLMILTFYLFAVFGFILFAPNDPEFFGDLVSSMLTLWQITTGDDWTEVMYTNMFGCNSSLNSPHYADRPELCTKPKNLRPSDSSDDTTVHYIFTLLFFMLFFLVAAILMINLVVGVIMISMMEAKAEQMNEVVEFKLSSFRRERNKIGGKIPLGKYLCTAQVNVPEGKRVSTESIEAKETSIVRWDSVATFSLLNKHSKPNKTVLFQVCRKKGCCGSVPLWQLHLDFGKMEENVPYRLDLAMQPCAPPGSQPPGKFILRVCVKKKTKADSVGEGVIKLEHFQDNFSMFERKVHVSEYMWVWVNLLHRMSKNYRRPINRSVKLSEISATVAPAPSMFTEKNENGTNAKKAKDYLANYDKADAEVAISPAPEVAIAPAPEVAIAPAPEVAIAPAPVQPASTNMGKRRLSNVRLSQRRPPGMYQPKPTQSKAEASSASASFPTVSLQGNMTPTTSEAASEEISGLNLAKLDDSVESSKLIDTNSVASNDSIESVRLDVITPTPML